MAGGKCQHCSYRNEPKTCERLGCIYQGQRKKIEKRMTFKKFWKRLFLVGRK